MGRKVLFFGRPDAGFVDNSKYLYLYFVKHYPEYDSFYIAEDKETYKKLLSLQLPTLYFDSQEAHTILQEKNIWVFSSILNKNRYQHYLTPHHTTIQLWHGVAIKNMKKVLTKENTFPNNYDYFISTSPFFTQTAFEPVFKAKKFLDLGYPRNDIFFDPQKFENGLMVNVDYTIYENLQSLKNTHKIVAITPTANYVDPSKNDMILGQKLDLELLEKIGKMKNIIFILKLHPMFSGSLSNIAHLFQNILFYPAQNDFQPILPLTDALITDYSSIYFDYLLLNKPILFFAPDLQLQLQNNTLLFPYEKFAPGPICTTFAELIFNIKKVVLKEKDTKHKERENLKQLSFTFQDGNASERISKIIMKELSS